MLKRLESEIRANPSNSRGTVQFYFWKFIHNAIIHPLLSFPWSGPRLLLAMHDWTSKRCPGAG